MRTGRSILIYSAGQGLTLKPPITAAADDCLMFLLMFIENKTFHAMYYLLDKGFYMKSQILFSLINDNMRMSSASMLHDCLTLFNR